MQNSLIIPQKIKHRVRYVLAFSFPAYTREILKTSTQSLCMNGPTNILLNGWQVETTQMSTNWWMNKQNVVYLFGFSHGSEVKNPSVTEETQEIQVQSLSQEDPLGEDMATHSSVLSWKIPWTEEPGRLQSKGSQRVGQGWVTEHP